MNFQEFCKEAENIDRQEINTNHTFVISYSNSQREFFSIDPHDIINFLKFISNNYQFLESEWEKIESRKNRITKYEEKSYRAIYKIAAQEEQLKTISSTGRSQTKPLTRVISKLICFLAKLNYVNVEENTYFDKESIDRALENVPADFSLLGKSTGFNTYENQVREISGRSVLPKQFLLLSGVSGTGKTRFIRQQAEITGSLNETYCLVSVRPDWHEPSDLLGYISRLSGSTEYVITDILRFIVRAWKEISPQKLELDNKRTGWTGKPLNEIKPYWLCLDEMNLAPVEQYFSDYLSVLETREWYTSEKLDSHNRIQGTEHEYIYTCDALLKADTIEQLDDSGKQKLRENMGLKESRFDLLWNYFLEHGIALPFNMMVAGTVNMDETTHGFSRKVIDRALTFDFGEFFPNDFDAFFLPHAQFKALSYPIYSDGSDLKALELVKADNNGEKSVEFLKAINAVLRGSSFELAYRALNELLLSVICFRPENDIILQAVWDDFMMCKVLPRIEGDYDKLAWRTSTEEDSGLTLLDELTRVLAQQLGIIWGSERNDLLREPLGSNGPINIPCRSKKKLLWMKDRLDSATFTSFWP